MKKSLSALLLIAFLCVACNHDDHVVAEVHNKKLFASEVAALVPSGLSAKDSIDVANHIIEDWITEQVILHEADKSLSVKEKIFDKEINDYKKSLLKNRYFEKITSDGTQFQVSDKEVREAIKQSKVNLVSDKEIVRLNYVKLPRTSKLIGEFKEILFDEERRTTEKEHIAELCGDSLEYFINDDQWLFWEDIQLEINIEGTAVTTDFPKTYEKVIGDDCYLVVILAYKEENTGEESKDYFESVRTMLIQKKKADFINQKVKELYQQAEKKGKINR